MPVRHATNSQASVCRLPKSGSGKSAPANVDMCAPAMRPPYT